MINTVVPVGVNKDADERLIKPLEMTDAINVTSAVNGEGSGSILKNLVGTTALAPLPTVDRIPDGKDVRVIGSVSDSQRGYVYWFVAGLGGSDEENAIYQQDVSAGTYAIVYKDQWLNFDPNGFVKADVVNAAFQQDGRIQTVLYFTDNVNPPRKINVDRIMAGSYSVMAGSRAKHFGLSTIKAAPTREPLAGFVTDANIKSNNLTGKLFQFATQFVYTDGEVSAISPYSKLSFSNNTTIAALDEAGFGRLVNDDNVCEIDTRSTNDGNQNALAASIEMPDAVKIRLLAREGNIGTFFVIDEVETQVDLVRNILGTDITIFNAQTGVYRFYNEGVYSSVPSSEEDKLYDNVPLLAEGQTVADNRLLYSNYNEGRANLAPVVDLSVNYSDAFDGSYSEDASAVTDDATAFDIDIDFSTIWPNAADVVPAGTTTVVEFLFNPVGTFDKTNNWALTVNATYTFNSTEQTLVFGLGNTGYPNTDDIPIPINGSGYSRIITVTNDTDVSRTELIALFKAAIDNAHYQYSYSKPGIDLTGRVISDFGTVEEGTEVSVDVSTASYSWNFDDVSYNALTGVLTINPYLSSFALTFGGDSVVAPSSGQPLSITPVSQDFTSSLAQSYLSYTMTKVLVAGSEGSMYSTTGDTQTSFKAGCMHDLGVVYYDAFNRSGFVNKLGSVYVNGFWERVANERGAAAIGVDFDVNSNAPTWADRYQIVYGGMSTYSDFTTYTAAHALPARERNAAGALVATYDTGNRTVYLSMETLDTFRLEKGAIKDYSFTEGDKLRVISYDAGTVTGIDVITYPTANNTTLPVEFDVMGVETFTDADTPLADGSGTPVAHAGTFLKLQAPSVANSTDATGAAGGEQLQYEGFDWYSITNTAYPNNDASSNTNLWGQRTVVEILSPRKSTSDRVYYEIGASYPVGSRKTGSYSTHGPPITVSNSDVYFRKTKCKTPARVNSTWNSEDHAHEGYIYKNIVLETTDVSDYFLSRHWSRGRAHIAYDRAANINRFSGVTYSDAYAEDVAVLSLSSFNPALANFSSLNSKYGAYRYIGDYSDGLVFVQENKVSFASMGRGIIQTSNGDNIASLSTDVIGPVQYLNGDFGCAAHPESVLIQDGVILFADISRRRVILFSGKSGRPISDLGMTSAFDEAFGALLGETNRKIVMGYNPKDNVFYVTMRGDDSSFGSTHAFNANRDAWEGETTFYPDFYSNQDNAMYSALFDDPNDVDDTEWLYAHTNEAARNSFHGNAAAASVVEVSFNENPTAAKAFNAVSVVGSGLGALTSTAQTNLGQGTAAFGFTEKEGTFYSALPKSNVGSTSNLIPVGRVSGYVANPVSLSFHNSIRGLALPIGADVVWANNAGVISNIGANVTLVSVDYTNSSIELSAAPTSNPSSADLIGSYADSGLNSGVSGKDIYLVTNSTVDGDDLRGQYMTLRASVTTASPIEIHSLSTNYSESKLNHG